MSGGPLRVGQSFSLRYHIIKVLGLGGMGAVYQAWDSELEVAVALKVIRTDPRRRKVSSEAEKRFKQELLLARQVTHKNVVRIHDLGEIDGIKYITMPYIQGNDLATVLRRDGKLPITRALHLARQVAGGLVAAHDAGVVHRDLKPANLMIGAEDLALITDFGISASADDAASGGIIGTLEYMAPEQGTGGAVDSRADIYALGMILYEMLAGPRPATATTPRERIDAMKQRTTEGLPPVRSLDETIPAALDAVVTRCLERDPAARYQTSNELVAALDQLDEHGELIPVKRVVGMRLLSAVVALALAMLGGSWWYARTLVPVAPHEPVSVVIADFQNLTGDPAFDRTLEPMLRRALEGASFVTAFDRNTITRTLGVRAPARFDEAAASDVALKQGLGVVLSGSVERQGSGYGVAVKAAQAVTGNVITTAKARASSKDQVLGQATRLVTSVRKALGDRTSESDQLFALHSVTATSLDVVRDYAAAVDASANNRFEEALEHAAKAVQIDPKFGLGYQLLAVYSRNLGRLQDASKFASQGLKYVDGMTEREKWATSGFYYRVTGDYQQCVKEYNELIVRYPADVTGRNQVALCSSKLRDLRRAVDEMRRVVTLLPNRALFRDNLALYASYAGDFQTGEQEASKVQGPDAYGSLALAFAQVGQGRLAPAKQTYQKLATIGALGASLANSGLADLAMVEGRYSEAARLLDAGISTELASKNTDRAASKLATLAHVRLLQNQKAQAVAAAERALMNGSDVKIRFMAGRAFIEAGAVAKARPLLTALDAELPAEPRAYAKILEGEIALKESRPRDAIKTFSDANTLFDTWLGNFDLGRAYFEAGAIPQADSQFDRSVKRRGEALSLFLDEEPTYGFFPEVLYYQGRVREAMKNGRFAESYRQYIDLRGAANEDRLLPEVRRRARP